MSAIGLSLDEQDRIDRAVEAARRLRLHLSKELSAIKATGDIKAIAPAREILADAHRVYHALRFFQPTKPFVAPTTEEYLEQSREADNGC